VKKTPALLDIVRPRVTSRRARCVPEEFGGTRTYEIAKRTDLAENVRGQLASDAREVAEDERRRDGVVERAVRRIGNDRCVSRQSLQRVARRRRQQDRRELGRIKRLGTGRHPRTLED
jgi:hypothetical protein